MTQLDLNNMVLNDVEVDSVTNSSGTGVFDKLMESVNRNIEEQYVDNRITGSDYANVYLGSLQAVLTQSIQFVLQEQLTEAQVASTIADNTLKAKQIELADIDKQLKQFELDFLIPEQLIKIQEEIDILQTQDSELLLNGVKDRLLKDADISMKDKQEDLVDSQIVGSGFDNTLKSEQALMGEYERTTVQPKNLEKTEEEIDILQTQDSEMLLNGVKDRLLKDADISMKSKQEDLVDSQIIGSGFDNTLKSEQATMIAYERTNVQPKQLEKLEEEIDMLQTQDSELLLNGVKDRLLKDADISMKAKQEDAIDSQIVGSGFDNDLKSEQALMGAYERTTVQPKKLEKLEEEIDILQTQDSEMLLDGTKKRLVMDEELETADLQQTILSTEDVLKNAQKDEVLASTARSDSQLTDALLTEAKKRIILDEEKETSDLQQIILVKEDELKAEQVLSTYTDRVLKDKQAAKLGLDNVMKSSEASRDADDEFIYEPKYTPGV
jgi:hypothetical protein